MIREKVSFMTVDREMNKDFEAVVGMIKNDAFGIAGLLVGERSSKL